MVIGKLLLIPSLTVITIIEWHTGLF